MKKSLLFLVVSLLMSSVALAAPVINLEKGQTVAGYLYWNPKVEFFSHNLGNSNSNGFFVENALSDKVILGIETIQGDSSISRNGATLKLDTRFTDVTLQYKVDENVRLIAGNRNYDTSVSLTGQGPASNSTNKFLIGISASAVLGEKTTGYASVLNNSSGTDYQIGVNQALSDTMTLNVNYRIYDEDNCSLKGIGAGLIYKF